MPLPRPARRILSSCLLFALGDPRTCALNRLHGIFVDTDGAVYIGDSEAHKIRVLRQP